MQLLVQPGKEYLLLQPSKVWHHSTVLATAGLLHIDMRSLKRPSGWLQATQAAHLKVQGCKHPPLTLVLPDSRGRLGATEHPLIGCQIFEELRGQLDTVRGATCACNANTPELQEEPVFAVSLGGVIPAFGAVACGSPATCCSG